MSYTYYRQAVLSGGWHSARMALQVNSQDIANNRSNVTLKLQAREDTNAHSFNLLETADFWIKIDGTVKASKNTFDWREYSTGVWYDQLTWTGYIYHNTDGTKAISLDAYIDTNVGAGYYNPSAISVTLPAIPRVSTLGTPDFPALETGGSIAVTKHATAFYDVLAIKIGATTIKTIDGYTDKLKFTLSDTELIAAYNALSEAALFNPSVIFTITTYSTSAKTTVIGTASKTITSATSGQAKVNVGGTWKDALVYLNVGGTWKKCLALTNVSGIAWRRGL